jgi:hypothetical protein
MPRKVFSCNRLLAMTAMALLLASAGGALAQSRQQQAEDRGAPYTRALNVLETHGYASFSNFREEGDKFGADVMQNGQAVHVIIDPDQNQVTAVGPSVSTPQTQSGAAR